MTKYFTAVTSFFNFLRAFSKNQRTNEYKEIPINSNPDPKFDNLVSRNKKILLSKGVIPNKVRFISGPCFIYDFIKDEINPNLRVEFPIMPNGLFDPSRKERIIGNDERNNRIWSSVRVHENPDWNRLVNKINNSKRGYVFSLSNEKNCHYEVDTNRIRFIDLDNVV